MIFRANDGKYSSTMEHMGVLMVFRIWLNRHAERSVPDNVSVAPVSKLDILKRIAMRCIGKNKCVLACSIYLSISVFVFVAGSALFQNHVTPLQRRALQLARSSCRKSTIQITRVTQRVVWQQPWLSVLSKLAYLVNGKWE